MMNKIPVIKIALLILSILMTGSSRTRADIEVPVASTEAPKIILTWNYKTMKNVSYNEEMRTEIEKALDYWTTPVTAFTFKEIPKDKPADITIVSCRYTFLKGVDEVAHSIYEDGPPKGTVYVDVNKKWTYLNKSDSEAVDLRIVLEHLLGYILGQESSDHFAAITTLSNYNLVKMKLAESFNDTNIMTERFISPENICEPRFDAVTDFEGDHVGFAGKYMYSEKEDRFALIRDHWTQLPENLTKVDAFYAEPSGITLFFIGKQIYKFQGSNIAADYPKDLRLWLNESRAYRVDAVFPHSNGTYVLSGMQYWKFRRTSLGDFEGPIGNLEYIYMLYWDEHEEEMIVIENEEFSVGRLNKLRLELAAKPKWKDFVCRPDQDVVRLACCYAT